MKIFLDLIDINGKEIAISFDSINAIRVNDKNSNLSEIFCNCRAEPFIVKRYAIDIWNKFPKDQFQLIK